MDIDKKTTTDSVIQQAMPLVSVIMPCYNAATYLDEAVKSVFSQSLKDVELIVIDDGSTDHSLQLLKSLENKYPKLSVLKQENMGPYPARNRGLDQAKGKYIAFLDADDYWSEDCLEKLYNELVSSAANLSYCGWQNIVEAGNNGIPYIPPAYEKQDIVKRFLQGCPWPIHAALVEKSIVSKINGFSIRRFSSMDYDFWLRITTVTQNITLVPEVLAFYRWHDKGQISAIKWRQVLDARSAKKDFISSNPELTSHLSEDTLNELLNAPLTQQAYDAFWKRDLVSAQKLFRAILKENSWNKSDLKYIIPSLLPFTLFQWLVGRR